MPNIVTCPCGANVRLPEGQADRKFRCPICKNGIALTVGATVLSSSRLGAGDAGATCPICQSSIAADEFTVVCPKCEQIHHRECWAEVGGCGTYGCEQAPSAEKPAEPEQPMSAWGDTKRCPVCGETIKAIAVRCRYCHTEFDTVNPLTLADVHRKMSKEEKLTNLQKAVIALFIVSMIGCLAPIALVGNVVVFLTRREDLRRLPPLFQILAYSSLGLSVLYSFLMLVFVIFSGF
jgi:hypothetical protein